jgi:hypothetical protein
VAPRGEAGERQVENARRPQEPVHTGGSQICSENGAQGRNRTSDTAIFNRMLYQLSYLGPDAVPNVRDEPSAAL